MKSISLINYVSVILIAIIGTASFYSQRAEAQSEVGTGSLLALEQNLKAEWKANEGNPSVQEHLHEAAKDVRNALCKLGREDYCPIPAIDLDALAEAVAAHESANGTSYSARVRNNYHGIMYWPNGIRTQRTFKSKEESYEAFKELWVRKFGMNMPNEKSASTYSGNDNPSGWLATVNKVYQKNCKRAQNCDKSSL